MNLHWNEIGDEGAEAIAQAIKVNSVLTKVLVFPASSDGPGPPITNHFFGALAGGPPTK